MTTLTPMVDVQFADLRTNENRFLETDNTNQATLLVLWSGWCGTCIADLEELGRHANSLRDANIRVVALCIDRIVRPETQRSKLIAIADQLRLPFALGWASQSLVDQLQLLHDGFILMADPLPVPVSFLIDTEGLLSVIYKGRVQPDWLLADVTHGTLSRDQRFQAAAPIAGRTIDDPSVQKARETGELSTRLRLASAFQRSGYLDAAARHFFAAGQLSPLSSHAHFGLGDVFLRQNRLAEAVRELQRATTLSSTHAEAHFRLALALEKQQHYATAVSHYRQGLKLEPSFFEAANNLAWILATHASPAVRSGVEAVRLAEKCATATDYRDASVLDTLAAAYAEAGEFEKAAGIQAQAIELSPAAGRQRFIERRQRYLSGQPYRMAN